MAVEQGKGGPPSIHLQAVLEKMQSDGFHGIVGELLGSSVEVVNVYDKDKDESHPWVKLEHVIGFTMGGNYRALPVLEDVPREITRKEDVRILYKKGDRVLVVDPLVKLKNYKREGSCKAGGVLLLL